MEENIDVTALSNLMRLIRYCPYKSIMRAIKRGHIAPNDMTVPKRPFNNRGNTCTRGKDSRETNTYKKKCYEGIKQRFNRESV